MNLLDSLKQDLNVMLNYKGWLEAIDNNAKKDLSAEWRLRLDGPIGGTIRILEKMIEECRFYIARYEVKK